MSYDISFKVKVEGIDRLVNVWPCDANITWNLRDMIQAVTGLEWVNEANNGLCVDVIPKIAKGYKELIFEPNEYRKYESPNRWGTVESCRSFFKRILESWEEFASDLCNQDLVSVTTFWVE